MYQSNNNRSNHKNNQPNHKNNQPRIEQLMRAPDAERSVLGHILLDDQTYGDAIDRLDSRKFPIWRDQQILGAMIRLRKSGQKINTITLANELANAGQLHNDTASYLASLMEGVPVRPEIESLVRLLEQKSALRGVLALSDYIENLVASGASVGEIVAAAQETLERLCPGTGINGFPFARIEDIPSVMDGDDVEIAYIRRPELPEANVVVVTGNTEAGKSSLAYAWARDAFRSQGIQALVLDRDNPRTVVRKRLIRLHMDGNPPIIFGQWFGPRPSQPDSPMVLSWVKRCDPKPIIIVDNLEAFIEGDENDAQDMRAFFDRCRRPADYGATVIVLHNNNREGKRRGSSVLDDAPDVGYSLTNLSGTRLLGTLRLDTWKHRDASLENPMYSYNDGWMSPCVGVSTEETESANEKLTAILRLNPNCTKTTFENLAVKSGFSRAPAREWLEGGVLAGTVKLTTGPRKNSPLFSLRDREELSEQERYTT